MLPSSSSVFYNEYDRYGVSIAVLIYIKQYVPVIDSCREMRLNTLISTCFVNLKCQISWSCARIRKVVPIANDQTEQTESC